MKFKFFKTSRYFIIDCEINVFRDNELKKFPAILNRYILNVLLQN